MGDNLFECVCQFFRAQSENLSTIIQGLGNQDTLSDLDVGDTLALNPQSQSPFAAATPFHFFVMILVAIWTFLYWQGQNKESAKPARIEPVDDEDDGPGGGGGGNNNAVS